MRLPGINDARRRHQAIRVGFRHVTDAGKLHREGGVTSVRLSQDLT